MGQPSDPRAYPPRFFEMLGRIGAGESFTFRFPRTEQGRRDCHNLAMRMAAFRATMRRQSAPEDLVAAAFEMEIREKKDYHFTVGPMRTWDDVLSQALDSPPGDQTDDADS